MTASSAMFHSGCLTAAVAHSIAGFERRTPNLLDRTLTTWPTSTESLLASVGTRVWSELAFVSDRFIPEIRKRYKKDNPSKTELDLSGIYIVKNDLSDTDFSSFDISNTIFDLVKIEGALLTPKKYERVSFTATAWWTAARIDQNLLIDSMIYAYPFYADDLTYLDPAIVTKEYYAKKIRELCVSKANDCRTLRFGQDYFNIDLP